MQQKKKVRLSDIAEKLGVSTVTISKAMANKEGVGDELRAQILQLAEEMGYRGKKSSQNSNVAGKLTGNVGILIPSRFFSQNHSFYWYLFNFVSTQLLRRNYYSIMELLSDEDEKNLELPRMIKDKKVDGLIILGQVTNDYVDLVNNNYKNFLLLDFYTNRMEIDSVSNDDFYCSYMITSYVISQGHKKLRFVGNFDATTSIRDRYMGFQKALIENNIPFTLDEIIPDRNENGRDIDIPLPDKKDMPTAFICNNDVTATIIMDKLIEMGYKIPEDISVTGFDNFTSSHNPAVELTTVAIRSEDLANVAAEVITKKISGQPYIKGRHLVSGNLLIRESVSKK